MLFRRVNSHFYDLELRGTTEIFNIFFGVSPKILKKAWVLPAAGKGFCLRREAAPATELLAFRGVRRFADEVKLVFRNCT